MKSASFRRLSLIALLMFLMAATFMLALPRTSTADELKPEPVAEEWAPAKRTWEEMQMAPAGPAVGQVPFRPTMSREDYLAAKAEASAYAPAAGKPEMAAPAVPPRVLVKNYLGVGQVAAGNWRPPDSEGAVGATEYVQVVNSHIRIYRKTDNALLKSTTLASFFGYTTESLFDPRVVYDRVWKRWIVTAVAFPESSTVMRMFVGVSLTSTAKSSFYIYSFNAVVTASDFFDFPMVGYDQDAIFITANIFDNVTSAYITTRMYYVAKAKVYNGLGANWYYFNGLAGTLAAPIAPDSQNAYTWFAAPQVSGTPANSTIRLYRFQNLSRANFARGAYVTLAVPGGFTFPPNAPQKGGNPLDTLDCRFENVSSQVTIGSRQSLFNVHCINYSGNAINKWYEIVVTNINVPKIRQTGYFFATDTSYDFNPHIAANYLGDCFVVWSATDPNNPTAALKRNAMVYAGGRRSYADLNTMGKRTTPLYISTPWYSTPNNPNRWGDYSAVTIDPSNYLQAWMTNEIITGTGASSTVWGTLISSLRY
jgi:hypothetical protein